MRMRLGSRFIGEKGAPIDVSEHFVCGRAFPRGSLFRFARAANFSTLPRSRMKVSDLRGILQYVPRFREKIFVLAVDGQIVASPNFPNILLDLAVLRSLNVKIILVHGASFQINELAAARGVTLSNADG